jgi:hypothetical protein
MEQSKPIVNPSSTVKFNLQMMNWNDIPNMYIAQFQKNGTQWGEDCAKIYHHHQGKECPLDKVPIFSRDFLLVQEMQRSECLPYDGALGKEPLQPIGLVQTNPVQNL